MLGWGGGAWALTLAVVSRKDKGGQGAHSRTLTFPCEHVWTEPKILDRGLLWIQHPRTVDPAYSEPREHRAVKTSLHGFILCMAVLSVPSQTMPASASSPEPYFVPGCPKNPNLYSVEIFYF